MHSNSRLLCKARVAIHFFASHHRLITTARGAMHIRPSPSIISGTAIASGVAGWLIETTIQAVNAVYPDRAAVPTASLDHEYFMRPRFPWVDAHGASWGLGPALQEGFPVRAGPVGRDAGGHAVFLGQHA